MKEGFLQTQNQLFIFSIYYCIVYKLNTENPHLIDSDLGYHSNWVYTFAGVILIFLVIIRVTLSLAQTIGLVSFTCIYYNVQVHRTYHASDPLCRHLVGNRHYI